MNRFRLFLIAIILSCQMTLVSAVGTFIVTTDEIHQSLSHERVLGHHHHDAFSTHVDHHNGEAGHQHTSDHFQTLALSANSYPLALLAISEALGTSPFTEPSSVYLDGLLRPPRVTVQ